jgi:hypothetical protein
MKVKLVVIIMFFLTVVSCKETNTTLIGIVGNVPQNEFDINSKNYVYLSNSKWELIDSSLVNNGAFCFKLNLKQEEKFTLHNKRNQSTYYDRKTIWLEPGEINVSGDFQCFQTLLVEGSKAHNQKFENEFAVKSDFLKMGKEKTLFKIGYINDHSIIYSKKEKKWHCYAIAYPQTEFLHLVADDLTQPNWEKLKPFKFQGKEIWAPHIVEYHEVYYMFYTAIGSPREIRVATSKDLYTWEHSLDKPVIAFGNHETKNAKNKDPMVFFDERAKQWIMYYSMMKNKTQWVVGYSTSKDLLNWSEYKICFDEDSTEPNVESPFVVKRNAKYYLFLSARPWPSGATDVFESDNPYSWDSKNIVKRINPWHAGEVVIDTDGKWYFSLSSGLEHDDFRIAEMLWSE